jgi:TPP-dependent pyruvate/acetoin dehydrogenase alpha subunit
MNDAQAAFLKMSLIRSFETRILRAFEEGIISGTTHTYIGQEANAVGVIFHLSQSDIIVSNHRCHGHFLAYGGDPYSLFAELMGKDIGICKGRGGSQHLHWKNFYSNGIQGGGVPLAAGMALAEKVKKSGAIVVNFIGDGTMGEGVLYETLNIVSLWKLPVLFVVENNHIAQTTPADIAIAGDIRARFLAFDIPTFLLDSSDFDEIKIKAGEVLDLVRNKMSPHALVIETYRLGPHSKGDDTRSEQDISRLKEYRDPIKIFAERLDPEIRQKIENEANRIIDTAYQSALNYHLNSEKV